jgi:hypothetical protein
VSERFLATPAFRCHRPAKGFSCEQEARRHAQQAADASRVAFVVWRVLDGRPVRLQAFPPSREEYDR